MKQIPSIRVPLEKVAASMLNPLFEKEVEIKAKIQAPMEEVVQKGMAAAESKLQELFAKHVPVIAAAAEAQLNMIHNSLLGVVNEVYPAATASEFDSKYSWMTWRGGWTWGYLQRPITVMIDAKLCASDQNAGVRKLGDNLISDLMHLNQSAFVALRQNGSEQQGGGAAELTVTMQQAYPAVMERVASDIGLLLNWRMAQALDSIVMGPLQENAAKAIDKICEPLNALIPELLQDVIDPARACNEIIQSLCTKVGTTHNSARTHSGTDSSPDASELSPFLALLHPSLSLQLCVLCRCVVVVHRLSLT